MSSVVATAPPILWPTSATPLIVPAPGVWLGLLTPQALRFEGGTQIEQWDAYREGRIEVQDHGSQMACSAASGCRGATSARSP